MRCHYACVEMLSRMCLKSTDITEYSVIFNSFTGYRKVATSSCCKANLYRDYFQGHYIFVIEPIGYTSFLIELVRHSDDTISASYCESYKSYEPHYNVNYDFIGCFDLPLPIHHIKVLIKFQQFVLIFLPFLFILLLLQII